MTPISRPPGRPQRKTDEEEAMNLYGPQQLVDSVRTVRKNTIRIAEDIPETDYGYRPTPDSRSVVEILVHIAFLGRADQILHGADRLASLESFDFGTLASRSESDGKGARTKSEILAFLGSEGDLWCRWVEGLPETMLSEQV